MIKLITEHKDYLLLAGGLATDEDEWYWRPDADRDGNNLIRGLNAGHGMCSCTKIIAHLPLNNAPVLEGVPLLPELPKQEEDVEQLAKNHLYPTFSSAGKYLQVEGFKEGYKASSKKYSKNDLIGFGEWIISYAIAAKETKNDGDLKPTNELFKIYYESLRPTSSPIGFEPEYDDVFYDGIVGWQKELKIEKGVLQGKLIFKN